MCKLQKMLSELRRTAAYILSWKEVQQARPQRWHMAITLHGVKYQTTALFTAAIKKPYVQLVNTELADSTTAIAEHADIPQWQRLRSQNGMYTIITHA